MIDKKTKYKSELILIFITLLWGATFPVVKEALSDISPILFVAIRFSIVALILLPFIIKKKINANAAKAGLLLGVFLFLGFVVQTMGLQYTSVIKSSFLTGTVVILVPILQVIIEKRPPTKGVMLGVFFVTLGISFLSSGGDSILNLFKDIGSNFNVGDALTLACAFFFAIYIVMLDIKTNQYDFFLLLFFQILATAVFAIIFSFLFEIYELEKMKIEITNNLIYALIYTSIFTTLLTTALHTKYQKNVTPAKAGIIFSFEPIFATFLSFLFLGEEITNFGYIGAGLIMLGLLVSELYESLIKNGK